MQVPVYNLGGEVVKNIEISDAVFGVPFNEAVVHQAMVRQRADARQGSADTKGRGEVAGSGKKIYAQKHTGEARAGDKRSPTRRHGGVAFGPHPRDYRKAMPVKARQLALRCMLSTKAGEGQLKVLEKFDFEAPKTKEMIKVIQALKLESSALIVTAAAEANLVKSARNIPGLKTLPASILNVVDLLSYQTLVMTEGAVRKTEEIWGRGYLRRGPMQLYDVIRRPLVTEKNTLLQSLGKYGFEVAREANKDEIKNAVEKAFKVTVTAVNIMMVRGQDRRVGRKQLPGSPWKKAIVTLKAGDKIQIFEGV